MVFFQVTISAYPDRANFLLHLFSRFVLLLTPSSSILHPSFFLVFATLLLSLLFPKSSSAAIPLCFFLSFSLSVVQITAVQL